MKESKWNKFIGKIKNNRFFVKNISGLGQLTTKVFIH